MQGEHGATTQQIWTQLSERLRRFVQSRIGSSADVDDLLQTVFLRIHTGIDHLREVDRLEAWVFQIARNAITDHFRKERPFQEGDRPFVEQTRDASTDSMHVDLTHCLRGLIERLPDAQRRALSMYELDGIAQKDIAIRESISLSGAKSRIQRGRQALAAMLKRCCEFQLDRRGNVIEYEARKADCCGDDCA